MSKQSIKATIDANIKQNGNQEITGNILNSVLNAMNNEYGKVTDNFNIYPDKTLEVIAPSFALGATEVYFDGDAFSDIQDGETYADFKKRVAEMRILSVDVEENIVDYGSSLDDLAKKYTMINVTWIDDETQERRMIATILPSTDVEQGWLYEYCEGWRLCKTSGIVITDDMTFGEVISYFDGNSSRLVTKTLTGDPRNLTTTDKSNLVSAINEVKGKVGELDNVIFDTDGDELYVADSNGNVVVKIGKDGMFHHLGENAIATNDWNKKVMSTYGDSVTALQNGDFSYPSNETSYRWGNRVMDYFKMSKHYGRGIGGQGYKWQTGAGNGGSVSFIKADGNFDSRNDTYNYDNYTGTIPAGCVKVRGCLASWSRITAMYPASIKDTIDVVLVMAHNDSYDTSECRFVEADTTDPEWAASGADYYGKINGDYDLTTFKGGVASTIMKLQLWMPQAIIVIMTGISGQGTTGQINTEINRPSSINKATAIKEMSALTSVPCIDVFSNDGINGWNRTKYIADTIHPYTIDGSKMVARAVIGGLKSILPNI